MLALGAWVAAVLWLAIALLPWRPASTRERLDTRGDKGIDLTDLTVLIPARNEAATLPDTLAALATQDPQLRVIVVDDQSSDATAACARAAGLAQLELIAGNALPAGWTGKLWALEQGRRHAHTELLLLLDADITLARGTIAALKEKLRQEDLALVSLMVEPRMQRLAECWLLPAFVYFFKLVYPFALSNRPTSPVAAAAGGCVLLRREALDAIGGFGALRDALIDDCALARHFKRAGYRTWLGLTHSARSGRAYGRVTEIWRMIERCAFTQLHYSGLLLIAVTLLFAVAFLAPAAALFSADAPAVAAGLIALAIMTASYLPTLRYYQRAAGWALLLPGTALLFLVITWSSAYNYWRGRRSQWKGRIYDKALGSRSSSCH